MFLDLVVYYSDTVYISETVCDTYTWHDSVYTTSGTYYYLTETSHGCDSLEVLNLTINYRDTAYFAQTACDSYEWHGQAYTNSGIYTYLTQTAHGCDSIEVLDLTINYSYSTESTDTLAGDHPYNWLGDTLTVAGDYTQTLMAINGCDSTVTLHLRDNPVSINTIVIPEQCAGEELVEFEIITQGHIDYLQILCSPDAKAAGLRDTTFTPPADRLFGYHHSARAGVHRATLTAYFHQLPVLHQDLVFKVLYPNTIFEQQWNDMITILMPAYNGGYDFTAFQWYKDGEPLQGETHSYLYQSLSFGAEYSALLTSPDGLQLMSCPIVPVDMAEISVYPTIVKTGESVTCHITDDATVLLFSSTGKLVQSLDLNAGDVVLTMPATAGIYMLKVLTINNKEREIKIIVR